MLTTGSLVQSHAGPLPLLYSLSAAAVIGAIDGAIASRSTIPRFMATVVMACPSSSSPRTARALVEHLTRNPHRDPGAVRHTRRRGRAADHAPARCRRARRRVRTRGGPRRAGRAGRAGRRARWAAGGTGRARDRRRARRPARGPRRGPTPPPPPPRGWARPPAPGIAPP